MGTALRITDLVGTEAGVPPDEKRQRADRWESLRKSLIDTGAPDDRTTSQKATALQQAELQARASRAQRGDVPDPATGASQVSAGMTRGLSEKANAAARALGDRLFSGDRRPIGDIYADRKDEEQRRVSTYRDANPGTSLALQLAGGLVTGAGEARLLTGLAGKLGLGADAVLTSRLARTAQRALPAAGAGAVSGAIAGGATSDANTMGGVLEDAGKGALFGAGAGVVIPALAGAGGRMLAPVARPIARALGGDAPVASGRAPTLLQRMAGNTLEAPAARPTIAPEPPVVPEPDVAPKRLFEVRGPQGAAAPSVREAPPTPAPQAAAPPLPPQAPPTTTAPASGGEFNGPTSDRAVLRLAKALRDGNITPDGLRGAGRSAAPSEIVADVAGSGAQRLLRGSEAVPSAGSDAIRTTLQTRQGDQVNRVTQAVASAFGQPEQPNLVRVARQLAQDQRATAQPLYVQAMTTPDGGARMVPRAVLQPYMQVPEFQSALTRARRMFSDDLRQGRVQGREDLFRDVVTGVAADGTPQVQLASEHVPLQLLDYVKKGLDAVIGDRTPTGALDRTVRASLIRDRNAMLQSVDALVPEYGTARAAYAGGQALRNAFEDGQDALRRGLTRHELEDAMTSMSPSESNQYRLGALGRLLEDVAGVADGRDAMSKVAGNRVLRDKLDILLPDDAARERMTDLIASEGRQTTTRRAIQGSRTAPLQQDIQSLADAGMPAAVPTSISGAVRAIAEGTVGRVTRANQNRMADELAPLLTMPARDVERVLQMLARAQQRQATSRAVGASVAGGAAGRNP